MMLAGVVPPASAGTQVRGQQMSERPDREIPRPKAVLHDGVRYEVVRNARMRGFNQAGGIVAAVDAASGEELWVVQVYEVRFDRAEERDAQEVFITRLRLAADKKHLKIANERDQTFSIDLASRRITPAGIVIEAAPH
jgi:hypothetical protein